VTFCIIRSGHRVVFIVTNLVLFLVCVEWIELGSYRFALCYMDIILVAISVVQYTVDEVLHIHSSATRFIYHNTSSKSP
jgi:hypothetical protein